MNPKSSLTQSFKTEDTFIFELFELFLDPSGNKTWLQKVVNLLLQHLNAKYLVLHTYSDNLIVSASNGTDLNDLKPLTGINIKEALPYWLNDCYIVPLSQEGFLQVNWNQKPRENDLKNYNNIFNLLATSLSNRSNLISSNKEKNYQEVLLKLKNVFSENSDILTQISVIAQEILNALDVSRCQIKTFSSEADFSFDSSLSVEKTKNGLLSAISVIPQKEQEWLEHISSGEALELNSNQENLSDSVSSSVESLLSIRSIFGCQMTYGEKAVGVLVLHECNYERVWKDEELFFIRQVALLLGIVIGKEFEIKEKYSSEITDINTGLIDSDELLREIDRLQIEARLSKSFFSLILIDIEKLKDVNLEMGFVAGNLVLSQTARYLKRLYGDNSKIARYNNDEFVVILNHADQNKVRIETEKLKDELSNISVLGVGPVDYNFSFVTFPTHGNSVAELLVLLEQAMLLSKSRGKSQVSGYDEVQGAPKGRWQQLVTGAIPEIILKKSGLKTGPEVIENIAEYLNKQKNIYSADILDSIQSLALALDAKDSYTEGHSKRVAEYASILAKNLSLDLQEIEWIRLAATMHDIGKIGIPESILCKPSKLTKEEYEIMKKHPVIGARILKPIKPLEKVANLVLYHHEYWDGSGYPNGMKGESIPIGSRIVSIVDAFQAMTSNRPYRATLPFEEAVKRLKEGKQKQWDPDLVELFIKIVS